MVQNDNTLKVVTHILGWFTGFLGPLIILLVTKEEEVKTHAKKALNWQISFIIYLIVSLIVSVILVFVLMGFLLIFALVIMDIIFCIMAAVKAGRNESWNYPLAIPFLK